MSIALVFCILAVLVQLVLGLLVLFKDHRKSANLVFSLQLFLFMLWSLAEIFMILRGVSDFSVKLLMTPGILLSYFFCIFSAIYPEYQKDARILSRRSNLFFFFVPAMILLWLLWSNQLIQSYSSIVNGFTISFGRFEFVAKGVVVAYLLYSLSTLSKSRKKAETKIQVRRLRYTFTAMLLPIAAGSIIIAAGKFFIDGNTAYTFGLFPLLSIVMSTLLAYTMLRYNLMEIDLMFSVGLVYTLLTAILAGFMELIQELMQDLLNVSDLWTKLVSVLVIAAFFSPLKDLLIRLVNHFFGRKTFDSARVMQHILAEMRRCRKVEKMMQRMCQELKLVLDFSGSRVCLEGFEPIEIGEVRLPSFATDLKELPDDINEIEAAVEYYRSIDQNEKSARMLELKNAGLRHFFRFEETPHHYGMFFLGGKSTQVPYIESEINLVSGICKEVPFLIENLRLIERLIAQERSSQELEWAKSMLEAISVGPEALELSGYSFAHFSSLSSDIKGDLIDYCASGNFIGLYDAFHHGIKAVLTLNLIYAAFRAENDAEKKLSTTNLVLQNFREQELCAAATLISVQNKKLEILTAGNPPLKLFSPDRCIDLSEIRTSPLGLASAPEFSRQSVTIGAKELLLISTNGLYKAFDELKLNLDEILQEKFSSPGDCRDKIVAQLSELLRSGFSDDITFLIAGRIDETTT